MLLRRSALRRQHTRPQLRVQLRLLRRRHPDMRRLQQIERVRGQDTAVQRALWLRATPAAPAALVVFVVLAPLVVLIVLAPLVVFVIVVLVVPGALADPVASQGLLESRLRLHPRQVPHLHLA